MGSVRSFFFNNVPSSNTYTINFFRLILIKILANSNKFDNFSFSHTQNHYYNTNGHRKGLSHKKTSCEAHYSKK